MSWNEVYLTMQGIVQNEAPIRRAAYLIHRSLVEKPVDIRNEWPLPLDDHSEIGSTFDRMKKMYFEQKALLEHKMRHGGAAA